MPKRTRPLVLIHASTQRASSVHELLVAKGFSVLEAPTEDLLNLFVELRPDMVLLEYQPENQSMEDLARKLRSTELGQVVPVILFGNPPGPNPIDIVGMGADQFAALPLDESWLEEKLARLGGGRNRTDGDRLRQLTEENRQDDKDESSPAGGSHPSAEEPPDGPKPQSSKFPGLTQEEQTPPPPEPMEQRLDLFAQSAEEEPGSVLGAISNVLSPGDLPNDQDIDIDGLDVETTIPGIPGEGTPVQDDTGESDLDIAEDTNQDQIWKDSRTGRLGQEPALDEPRQEPDVPLPHGAVSLPPWQVSTASSKAKRSTSALSPQRSTAGPPSAAFEPTHLADPPGSTEVITDGHPATPEQDTVVGLKWKQSERRGPRDVCPDTEDSDPGADRSLSSAGRSVVTQHSRLPAHDARGIGQGGLSGQPARRPETQDSQIPAKPDSQKNRGSRIPLRPGEDQAGSQYADDGSDQSHPATGPSHQRPWIPQPPREAPNLPVDFSETRPAELFMALASRETTTCLTCHDGTNDLEIFFQMKSGLLVGAACRSQEFSFQSWSIRRSLLTERQVHGFENDGFADANGFFKSLVDRGILTDLQLAALYRDWTAWLFYEVVGWRRGGMDRIDPDLFSAPVDVILDWPILVCEAVRRKYGPSLVMSLIGGADARRVWTSEQAMETALSRLDLSREERRALTLFAEGFSLSESARRAGLEDSDLAALIHGLDLLGILDEPAGQSDRQTASPLGSPKAQAARIEAKLDQIRESDYYTLLGVRPGAGLREVRSAYEQMKQSFDESALSEKIRLEYAAELKVIRTVLDEAVAVLTHPRYAALYAEALTKDHK